MATDDDYTIVLESGKDGMIYEIHFENFSYAHGKSYDPKGSKDQVYRYYYREHEAEFIKEFNYKQYVVFKWICAERDVQYLEPTDRFKYIALESPSNNLTVWLLYIINKNEFGI